MAQNNLFTDILYIDLTQSYEDYPLLIAKQEVMTHGLYHRLRHTKVVKMVQNRFLVWH